MVIPKEETMSHDHHEAGHGHAALPSLLRMSGVDRLIAARVPAPSADIADGTRAGAAWGRGFQGNRR
jgi:hypothetical protein